MYDTYLLTYLSL